MVVVAVVVVVTAIVGIVVVNEKSWTNMYIIKQLERLAHDEKS